MKKYFQAYSPEDFHAINNAACPTDQSEDEEALLVGHIQEIQKEKALLTSALPSLTRTTSDDDLLSTDIDDGSLDDADNDGGEIGISNYTRAIQVCWIFYL